MKRKAIIFPYNAECASLVRNYHADLNDTIEKRQQKFIRKVGNPYMMRVGKMKVKVSFANNGVSIEEAFKNMLLTV